jgi:hypothetical protein
MGAHLRDIRKPKCRWQNCDKPATVELHNTWNALIGEYCQKHGSEALKDFEKRHEEAPI